MAPGRGTFGLSSARGRGRGNFRANYRGGSWRGRGRGRGGSKATGDAVPIREDDGTQLAERFERAALNDEVDEKLGFGRIQEGGRREGWLVNMHPVSDFGSGSLNKALMIGPCRRLLKIQNCLLEKRRLTFILFKMMGGCLNVPCSTNRTFASHARYLHVLSSYRFFFPTNTFSLARKPLLKNG